MFEKRRIATLVAAAGLALPMAASAQSLELEYSITDIGGGQYLYHFETFPDAGWAPGMGWRWYIWGDCQSCPTPLTNFVGDPSFLPVGPWTGYSTSGGFHNGPTFSGVLDYWIPASGTERLVWEGTSTAYLPQGELLFSTIAGTVGGALAADFKVATLVGGGTLRFTELLGDAAPPSELCGKEVTPFPLDDRPLSDDVTTVPSPICGGGELTFSIPMSHRRIGAGWGTWSHGYTGDVYYTNGAASMDVGVPDNTSRFYLYVEPNPFSDIEFEISYSGGGGSEAATETISGSSGAKGFGFCDDKGIDTIGVRTTDGVTDFAIGEFGICTDVPEPFCYADCDESGELDFFDFLCFQNQFGTGDCRADCDDSGTLDFFDFLCFQNEFAAGCPELQLIQLGVEAPPGVICGEDMEEVIDTRPTFSDVTTVPTSIGDITFDIPCSHRVIGGGWGTWSHGYTGSVYYTNGGAVLNVGAPAGNTAFYLYVEPNPFALIEFEITGSIGGASQSVIESINGSSGAAGYAFCGGVENVEVRTTDGITDFAVGEFGVAN